MAEDRWGKRYETEMVSLFGHQQAQRNGVIRNISLFGLQISSSTSFPEQTMVAVTFTDPMNKCISLEAKVCWQMQTKRNMQNKKLGHCKMGLQIARFVEGENHYRDLCYNLCWDQAQVGKVEGAYH